MKKKPAQDRRINQSDRRQDNVKAIAYPLKIFLEHLSEIEDRRANAQQRMADAINKIAAQTAEKDKPIHVPLPKKDKSKIQKYTITQRRVLQTIFKMRKRNRTYEEIAQYLEWKNIPTFSMRGKWYAQTVHQLCIEYEKNYSQ